MRIVMMGTGPFAVPTFRSLLISEHEVICLFTQPPRAARGKRKPPPNPMHQAGEAADLRIETPQSINSPEAHAVLQELGADLFVVCDYGQILSSDTLGMAPLGGINLHGSLLPKYRGAAPVQWAVFDGCQETGVTVIHMTRKLDAGPTLVQRTLEIKETETAAELEERLAEIGIGAVDEALIMLTAWNGEDLLGTIQDNASASKAPRLKKSDGCVDWSRTAQQLSSQVRAFHPWPGSFTHWLRSDEEPLRVVIEEAYAYVHDEEAETAAPMVADDTPPGTVIQVAPDFLVTTGDGQLELVQLKPAGRRVQEAAEFLRGYRVAVGDRLGNID